MFSKVVMNPPYYGPKPEGMKRSSAHLDIKIWDIMLKEFPKAEIVALMSHACLKMKGHEYTTMEYAGMFPGAAIQIGVFTHLPVGLYLGNEAFIDKYEENGMKPWIREHDLSGTGESLYDLVSEGQFDSSKPVPDGYCVFHERSGKQIKTWMTGEVPTSKTLCYVKTADPKRMKEFIENEVSAQYAWFLEKFGSGHVHRGFSKTVRVPDDLR